MLNTCPMHKYIATFYKLRLIPNMVRNEINRGYKSRSQNAKDKNRFSHTVRLPQTSFPLRISPSKRVETDLFVYNTCKFSQLYEWQRQRTNDNEFILHDGPPYANGNLHMGHAINKILKDITVRQKYLQGFKIHYIPGWDCHGLPIELKATTTEHTKRLSSIEIRQEARKIAMRAIEDQMTTFKSWGIMTNWNESYYTFNKEYIKNQLYQFLDMYEKGLIYRDLKPVFWSPSSGTALAEAELVYDDRHVSKSILLSVSISKVPESLEVTKAEQSRLKALIWTTTPWTLPANQAICYNPNLTYCIASSGGPEDDFYMFALDTLEEVEKLLGKKVKELRTFQGDLLKGTVYHHPMQNEREQLFLPASHVTSDKGTGLVHTAPAHGPEDFLVAVENNLSIVNLVGDDGCYTSEVGPKLEGLNVLENGNNQVLLMLKPYILHCEDYVHSYPCDWRTKQPIIIKASHQWFIDTKAIKEKAINLLQEIDVYPQKHECHSTLITQLEKRPYWCISRQRVWGVPIPVLYRKYDESPITSRNLINHFTKLLDEHGPDFWWSLPEGTLTPYHVLKDHGLTLSSVEKGKDILDIWFDSGLSWSYVLGQNKIADLYLEGMDQYTGWFQSSLMTSVALRGKSPYRSLYVHGFAVDENGHKMSKSVGNVVYPEEITQGGKDLKKQPAFGVDTLRWWVASHAAQGANVPVSQNIMEASSAEVQKIRIVLRFLIGCLHDFTQEDHLFSLKEFYVLDLWMLHQLRNFETKILQSYNDYQYNNVCKILLNFVTNEVSSIYCHMVKDRLYCRKPNDKHRLSCQYVMKHILEIVAFAAAPILPFLVEELFLYYPCKRTGEKHFFYSSFTKSSKEWNFPQAEAVITSALAAKEILNKTTTRNTMELNVQVHASGNYFEHLRQLSEAAELNEILQVSSSEVVKGTTHLSIQIEHSSRKLCPRCRQYVSQNEDILCLRCEEVVKEINL